MPAGRRVFDRNKVFRATLPYGLGPLTLSLILTCVIISCFIWFGDAKAVIDSLLMSQYRRGLPEIANGEWWRLLTPIFVHRDPLHLFFNMMWLFDLGSMIEGRQSVGRLALLVVVIGVLSNLGQYWLAGPLFYGMSGVVYGLLGYIWIRGKFDPASGLFLHRQTVTMMLIWFFLCMTPLMKGIANGAHAVGLMTGMAWGFLSSLPAMRNRSS